MSDKTYVFEPTSGQMDAATAALLSNRNNNGGLFGSNGIEGLIGLIIAAGIFGGGNGNGWFGGGGNNNTEREMILQAINRNGNDINSLAAQLNCSTGQVNAAINAISTQLCNLSGQVGMSSQQIINSIQSGNASLASQLCNCCCEIRQGIAESNYLTEKGFCNTNQILSRGFSDLGYATRDQTCNIEKAIAASTESIMAGQRNAEMREMQREITERDRRISEQATAINNYQQTQTFAAMLQNATNPLAVGLQNLQSDVDGIKCKLPKTETIIATPDYVPINRGINVNYAPYSCLGGFGFPFGFGGFNNGNGSFF